MVSAEKRWRKARFRGVAAACSALLWLAGCNHAQSDRQLQQQAAHATRQMKAEARDAAADAKIVADDAKIAAARAERKVNDISAGVQQGLGNKTSSSDSVPETVNINHASEARLTTLPGVTPARARRIMLNRPYDSPHDLVKKGVLTEAQYARIAGRVDVWDN